MTSNNQIFKNSFIDLKGIIGLFVLLTLSALGGVLVATKPDVFSYFMGLVFLTIYIPLAYRRPFLAFTILVFFGLTILLSRVKIVADFSTVVGLGLIFSIAWISRLSIKATPLVKVREYLILIGLSGIVIISTLFNLDNPNGFSALPTYLQLYLLLILVVNMVTTPSRLRVLSGIIILSSTILAVFILLDQYALLPPGLIKEQYSGVQIGASLEMVSRTGGLWGDANYTAVQLTVALPFIVAEWVIASALLKRVILAGAAGVILAAFSFTLSIGGLVGLLAFLLIKALQDPRRDIARIFVRCVLIISIAIVLIYVLLPDLYVQRVIMSMDVITSAISTQNPDLLLRFGTTRGDIWQAALKSITVSPLMGHGPGNGSFEIIRHSLLHSADYNMSAHNMFLAVGADLGLIGLALFCLLLASAIWSVRPLSDSRTYGLPLQRTGETIFVALVVYVVQGLALDIHNLKLLWVLMGMAIAYRRLNVLQNQEMTKTRIPK